MGKGRILESEVMSFRDRLSNVKIKNYEDGITVGCQHIMVKHIRIAFFPGKKWIMVMRDQESYVGIVEVFIRKNYMSIAN